MEIYRLTPLGTQLARSARNPNTKEWQVIHFLDKVGRADKDKIAEFCGLSTMDAAIALRYLRGRRIVSEETGALV